jgi:hypothetical protein
MALHKDINNKIHEIEPAFAYLLPAGSVQITEEEATILLAPPPLTLLELKAAVQSQIDTLEDQTHMNRFVREAMLLTSVKEAALLGYTEPMLYAANIGYRKVKDLDIAIGLLRAQMV